MYIYMYIYIYIYVYMQYLYPWKPVSQGTTFWSSTTHSCGR